MNVRRRPRLCVLEKCDRCGARFVVEDGAQRRPHSQETCDRMLALREKLARLGR